MQTPSTTGCCAPRLRAVLLIEQVDPVINVAFVAILKSGDQVALFNWWKANDTIIEP